MKITRLPFSETTQKLFDMANEMRENMDKAFKAQYSGSIAPTESRIMLHERIMKENMRGVMAQLHKAVATDCPGVLISFTDDELKVRAISPEEFYIQPVEDEKEIVDELKS